MADYSTLLFDVRNNVAYITLNRPEAANALNAELAHDLMEVSLRCEEDPSVRAVLLKRCGQTLLRRRRPQELRRAAQRDAADLLQEGHLSSAQGDFALQSDEGAGGAGDSWRGGRRRDESRVRGRYRDRGGVGEVHDGVHAGGTHARRIVDLLPAAHRRPKACDGPDAHQPRALGARGLRDGNRDPRGARRRADGDRRGAGEGLRAGSDARLPWRQAPVRRERDPDARRSDGARDRVDRRHGAHRRRLRGYRVVSGKAAAQSSRASNALAARRAPSTRLLDQYNGIHQAR